MLILKEVILYHVNAISVETDLNHRIVRTVKYPGQAFGPAVGTPAGQPSEPGFVLQLHFQFLLPADVHTGEEHMMVKVYGSLPST